MAINSNNDSSALILIESNQEVSSAIRNELNNIPEANYNVSERRNLDGTAPLWITIATLSLQALPPLLNFLSSLRRPKLPTRIKIGDIEIENPTEEDMERLRKLFTKESIG
jgi:hypothetical protein